MRKTQAFRIRQSTSRSCLPVPKKHFGYKVRENWNEQSLHGHKAVELESVEGWSNPPSSGQKLDCGNMQSYKLDPPSWSELPEEGVMDQSMRAVPSQLFPAITGQSLGSSFFRAIWKLIIKQDGPSTFGTSFGFGCGFARECDHSRLSSLIYSKPVNQIRINNVTCCWRLCYGSSWPLIRQYKRMVQRGLQKLL